MNLRPLAAASLALISGCMSLVDSPERFGFRDAIGADETPREDVERLAIPVLDLLAAPCTAEELRGWCAGLSSDDPAERDRCEAALRAAGEVAVAGLEDVRRSDDREASARASALIDRAKFGDVAALRALLESHLGPQERAVALLAGPLDPRMADASSENVVKLFLRGKATPNQCRPPAFRPVTGGLE